MKKIRPIKSNWHEWLINYIPESTRKSINGSKDKVISVFKTNTPKQKVYGGGVKCKVMVDALYNKPDDCAVLGSFLHHTRLRLPKIHKKEPLNIFASTDLDRQKTKKTGKIIRTYFTTKTKKISTAPKQLPKFVIELD